MSFEKDFRSGLDMKNIMFFERNLRSGLDMNPSGFWKRVSNMIFSIESIMLFTKKISDLKNKSDKT